MMTILAVSAIAAPRQSNKGQGEKIINGPRVEGVGDNWAVIAWTTNTGGSTIVRYGTNPKQSYPDGQSALRR